MSVTDNKRSNNVRMKRLLVKIEMLKNTNRYQLLKPKKKKKHASVKALVYPSNFIEIYQTTVCRVMEGLAGCKPNIITTPMFKELTKNKGVFEEI